MKFDRRRLFAAGFGLGLFTSAAVAKQKPADISPQESGTGLLPASDQDQTAALQRLIDEAANRRAPLKLPPGRFLVRTLALRAGSQISGAGSATILRQIGGGAMLLADRADGLRLDNLTLDGALLPLDAARAKGLITVSRSAAISLRDLILRDSLMHGIVLEECAGTVAACGITGVAEAAIFSTDAGGLEINNNTISGAANNGILVWRSKQGDDGTIVSGNRIEKIASASGGSGQNGNGINVYRAGNVLVKGNRIADCAFSAVRGNAASNIQMVANNCQRLGEVALYAEFGFQGALIANNVVDTAATGVSVTNFNEGGRLAVVQGNLIRNLFRREHEPVDKRGDGIAVEADAVIAANTIENAPACGIMIGWGRYMRDVTATSNLIRNARVGIGVTGDAGAGAVMITANMISGARDGAIRALKLAEPYGPDLGLTRTESARVMIERNLSI
jgi:uncharacterized secreted repeat protein (TIGR03808 family)